MKDVYLKQQIILSTCIIEKEHQHPTFWPNYKVNETYHNPSLKLAPNMYVAMWFIMP